MPMLQPPIATFVSLWLSLALSLVLSLAPIANGAIVQL